LQEHNVEDIFASGETLFNHIVAKMIEQGVPSYSSQTCFYRLEQDGKQLKCAVGMVLKDEDYDPQMESHGIFNLVSKFKVDYLTGHADLLGILQNIHDTTALDYPAGEWLTVFKDKCRSYAEAQGWGWKHG
jgi:hypothetical protein